jgi:glycosyltransferase involved in cell wall biosynthesis
MSISVIIPAYNRAMLLRQTLDAVVAQTAPPDEIIVVDDGSTDGTPAVAQSYGARVNCIVTVNGGDLVARNIGLRMARGRLVAFCDSDDLWRPDFLARMLALWQAEPDTQAACADFVTVRDGEWDISSKFASAPAGYWDALRPVNNASDMAVFDTPIVDRLIRFQPFFPSCLMANRQAFLAVGGWDEGAGRTVGTDFATMLRLAERPPFGVVRRPLVGIRKHAGNFSADVQAMNLGDACILEHVLATRPGLQNLAGPIRTSIDSRRLAALDSAFVRREFTDVRQIRALLTQPLPRLAELKSRVAALPGPLRAAAVRALLAMGSLR